MLLGAGAVDGVIHQSCAEIERGHVRLAGDGDGDGAVWMRGGVHGAAWQGDDDGGSEEETCDAFHGKGGAVSICPLSFSGQHSPLRQFRCFEDFSIVPIRHFDRFF